MHDTRSTPAAGTATDAPADPTGTRELPAKPDHATLAGQDHPAAVPQGRSATVPDGEPPAARCDRTWTARRLLAAACVPTLALALAACSSTSSSSTSAPIRSAVPASSAPTSTSSSSSTSSATRVAAARVGDYGTVLVTSTGRTLYMLTADTPTSSACTGACTAVWPPLTTTGTPTAGSGVRASDLGTITRAGGARQVTYNGHPLYTFSHDSAPGQANGEGIHAFGGTWYVLDTAGNPVTAPVSSSSAGTTSSGASSSSSSNSYY